MWSESQEVLPVAACSGQQWGDHWGPVPLVPVHCHCLSSGSGSAVRCAVVTVGPPQRRASPAILTRVSWCYWSVRGSQHQQPGPALSVLHRQLRQPLSPAGESGQLGAKRFQAEMCLWNVKDIFGGSLSANTTHIIGCKCAWKVIQIEQ